MPRWVIFQGLDNLYEHKIPFVRNLFWCRVQTALDLADIDNYSTILDVGSGSGHLLRSIRNVNAKCKCYGVDVIDSDIAVKLDCTFKVGDVRALPFPDAFFDIVFVLDILEHLKDDVDLAIKELRRVMKPEGIVILSGPTESIFYQFCRRILFWVDKKRKNNISLERIDRDYHYHTVYELENIFRRHSFKLSKHARCPHFPFPQLFRISRFQLQN
jgi:ubiquinone/menaquinone biosynthesis C-methylase UbiE